MNIFVNHSFLFKSFWLPLLLIFSYNNNVSSQPYISPSAGISISSIKSSNSSTPKIASNFITFGHIKCSFGYKSIYLSSAVSADIAFLSTGVKSDYYSIKASYLSTSLYLTHFFDIPLINNTSLFTSFGGFTSAKITENAAFEASYRDLFGYERVLKNYDAGLHTAIGFEYRKFILRASSSLGLVNLYIQRDDLMKTNLYSTMLSATLGYKFNLKND